jgi:signal transduction histidine kinase
MIRTFPARAESLREIRAFVQERASETSFYPEVADDLILAVSEACANSVKHSHSRTIEVRWNRRTDGAEVQILDDGVFGGSAEAPRSAQGFGITMMRALVDEVAIEQGTPGSPGTRVRLVMRKRERRALRDRHPA